MDGWADLSAPLQNFAVDNSVFCWYAYYQTSLYMLTRVERTEYEIDDRQRSDREWKVGMATSPQNAFVSG